MNTAFLFICVVVIYFVIYLCFESSKTDGVVISRTIDFVFLLALILVSTGYTYFTSES